jgi:hypothetical protein
MQSLAMEPITVVLCLLLVHAGLGAFDTFFNHEWQERLPHRPEAATEVALHSLRSAHFAVIFGGVAWLEWHGAWGWAMLAVMGVEYAVTIVDSVVEDRTRRLSAVERVNHMLLAINTGLYMALFAWHVATRWHDLPSGVAPAQHPAWLVFPLTLCTAAVLVWTVRDAAAARRLATRLPVPAR